MIVLDDIVPPEQVTEDGRGSGKDDFVGVQLTIVAREGNINMVCIRSQFLENSFDIRNIIIPL